MNQTKGAVAHISDGLRRHIEQALINVDNSFLVFEMDSRNIPQAKMMSAVTRISFERFAGNVMILSNWMIPVMQDQDYKDKIGEEDPMKAPRLYHQAIIQLLERQGFFLGMVPRTLVK